MPKQGSYGKNWCFTVNNWTEEDIKILNDVECGYIIYGKEEGDDKQTPHLQGYIQFSTKKRITALKKIHKTAHWEKAKADGKTNVEYCSKDGKTTERGVLTQQGKRKCDMVNCVKMTLNNIPTEDILDKHGAGYILNKRKIDDIANKIEMENNIKILKKEADYIKLKEWQEEAIDILLAQKDREVLFIVDEKGGQGKSFLTDYLIARYNAIAFDNGKSADIKYGYNGQALVIFDLCRCELEFINYGVIENIKNGRFFSTKYECKQKVYPVKPKVVVMMNEMPDKSKLSEDRFIVYLLTDNKIVLQDYIILLFCSKNKGGCVLLFFLIAQSQLRAASDSFCGFFKKGRCCNINWVKTGWKSSGN